MAMKPAAADEDSEREQLARISYELQRLQSMVDEASRRAPTGQRISFRYEWLKR
ncbi:RAQPRD family integrative conjugative element protein, partial [Escherichia coli]|uniref:RAQPRD family integrative conjugative element protein n=2 Tax=Pseudomonadota TaxID=1224 RepID=UPI00116F81AF